MNPGEQQLSLADQDAAPGASQVAEDLADYEAEHADPALDETNYSLAGPVAVPGFRDSMTLGEARDLLRKLVDDGARCPCCTQYAKVYRRKVNSTQAMCLIRIYREYGREYGRMVDRYRELRLPYSLQVTTMGYWGLVEEQKVRKPDGGRGGIWRVTELGEAWVLARATIPKYARIYNDRVLSHEGDQVTIREALGEKFRYDDLMEGI